MEQNRENETSFEKRALEMNLSGRTEERGDRYAVWSNDFGFWSYGITEEEALDALWRAITNIITCVDRNNQLEEYLKQRGITYRLIKDFPAPMLGEPHYATFDKQLRVPLDVAG